jgi:hypothetical protein
MSLGDLYVFEAAEAKKVENCCMFTFEVDYDVYEGFKGPHDYDTVLVRMAVGCLGEVVLVGRVWSSQPLYGDDGYTIGVQLIKVALADVADLK